VGMVWFKFEYYAFPSENFGINLLLDIDSNPENGSSWFSNREFKYDVLATVWLRREGGQYIGINGLSETYDSDRRRMTMKASGNIDFYLDVKNKQVIIGIPLSDLNASTNIKVAGTVGSNLYWADNIPDKGFVVLK